MILATWRGKLTAALWSFLSPHFLGKRSQPDPPQRSNIYHWCLESHNICEEILTDFGKSLGLGAKKSSYMWHSLSKTAPDGTQSQGEGCWSLLHDVFKRKRNRGWTDRFSSQSIYSPFCRRKRRTRLLGQHDSAPELLTDVTKSLGIFFLPPPPDVTISWEKVEKYIVPISFHCWTRQPGLIICDYMGGKYKCLLCAGYTFCVCMHLSH